MNGYVKGNNALKIDARAALQEMPSRNTLKEIRSEEKRKKKMHMSVLYIAFLAVMLTVLGKTLVTYISLQSEITNTVDNITAYEDKLQELTLDNSDEYAKINSEINLDDVRRIAIEDLGMVYADENQIIKYTKENSDYVRQFTDIPN